MTLIADGIYLFLLAAVVAVAPIVGRRDQRRLERELADGDPSARARSYVSGMGLEWITAGVLFASWLFTTRRFEDVFLVPGWSGREWVAVAAGALVGAVMVAQTIAFRGRHALLAKVREKAGTALLLAPRTPRELRLFDGLSLAAGVCEELVYRGLLLGTLAAWIGLWPAVLVSSIVFGLAHVYQGAAGAMRAGLFGAVAAGLTVFSGSIYLAVVVHVIVDASQGRLLAMALRSEPQTNGRAK